MLQQMAKCFENVCYIKRDMNVLEKYYVSVLILKKKRKKVISI